MEVREVGKMDIRFVNSRNEIINATNLSIKVNDRYLIGETAERETTIIETYENWEESSDVLKQIAETLLDEEGLSEDEIIIDLRREEEC